eukprot:CAMPEP_0173159056 /NCGR_PEP_ID=MMETSP1105-20130129/16832_1 /TAXON_ID=2985 /ORGANISM="Ochromonas sp., Strain BG-1" /LENGTH=471 /DNA_ID=CAMNT_0014077317 /DNA_START=268 /DNA_END=1680 /DNA_ORIENTATION=-
MIFVYLCLLCQERTADAFHLHRYIPTHHYPHQLKPAIPHFATTTSLPSTASAAIPAKELEEFSEKRAQIPLRIAVAGAGIGGAILGAALQQKGFDVTVFEKAAKFSRFGGPIQLASNALSCVNALSPTLFEKIMSRFTFTGTRKCGIKDGVRNEWYAIFDAIPQIAEERSLPYTGVIDRPDLQEILLETMKPGTVKNSKSIDYYQQNKDGTVDIYFADGESSKGFDILIGADGIWSAVRRQMWNEGSQRPGTCTYSGYTLFAAESILPPDSPFFHDEGYFEAGYKVYIGPGKYFVTSDVGSGRIQWYAFLGLPPGTKARESNVQFVKEQFAGWSPEIHACLDNTPEEIIEQRDLYDRRPSMMRSWSDGHVTMLGDAVHPMMPNLGQGGCQAIEDTVVLADELCSITDKSQIPSALQSYYQRRIVRSAIVQGMSRFSSDIIISQFSTPFNLKEFLKEGFSYKYLNPQSIMTW